MNNDDRVRRLKQREQNAEAQRLAEQMAQFRAFRESIRMLLLALRRDLPTLLARAENALTLLVQEERREVGRFPKREVVEEQSQAGWELTSWKTSTATSICARPYIY